MEIAKAKKILSSYMIDKKFKDEISTEIYELEQKNEMLITKFHTAEFYEKDLMNKRQLLALANLRMETIEKVINRLNPLSRNVLYYRYLRNMTHCGIAMKMNYSEPRIYQLMNVALIDFTIACRESEEELFEIDKIVYGKL